MRGTAPKPAATQATMQIPCRHLRRTRDCVPGTRHALRTVVLFCLALHGPLPAAPAVPDSLPAVDSSQAIANRIIRSKKTVLVDFWAVWCGPCRILDPILKELEKEYGKRVEFMKVNVDVHRRISGYFGVSSIPAVFIIRDKTVQRALTGVRDKTEYRRALDEVLALPAAADTAKAPGR